MTVFPGGDPLIFSISRLISKVSSFSCMLLFLLMSLLSCSLCFKRFIWTFWLKSFSVMAPCPCWPKSRTWVVGACGRGGTRLPWLQAAAICEGVLRETGVALWSAEFEFTAILSAIADSSIFLHQLFCAIELSAELAPSHSSSMGSPEAGSMGLPFFTEIWNIQIQLIDASLLSEIGIKLILDDQEESLGLKYIQFGIIQVLQRSLISQTSNWPGTFFSVSYSKPLH